MSEGKSTARYLRETDLRSLRTQMENFMIRYDHDGRQLMSVLEQLQDTVPRDELVDKTPHKIPKPAKAKAIVTIDPNTTEHEQSAKPNPMSSLLQMQKQAAQTSMLINTPSRVRADDPGLHVTDMTANPPKRQAEVVDTESSDEDLVPLGYSAARKKVQFTQETTDEGSKSQEVGGRKRQRRATQTPTRRTTRGKK